MGSCNAFFVFPNLIPTRGPSRLGATNQGFDLDFRISSWSRIMFDNMFPLPDAFCRACIFVSCTIGCAMIPW